MPRDFAQVYQSIWSDPDFRQREGDEQLLYLKLLSWETLNYAGVLPLQPRKWTRATAGLDVRDVVDALQRLDAARYVLVDWDTEEALLRTFIRGDGLWRNPPMLRAALRQAQQIESARLRLALAEELATVLGLVAGSELKDRAALTDDLQGVIGALSDGVADGVPDGVATPSQSPVPEGVPDGVGHGVADGAGEVRCGEQVSLVETSGGNATEVDAGANEPDEQPPTVPHTGPAPLEDPQPDEAPAAPVDPAADERAYEEFVTAARERTSGPAVHENAMPPARCRNHENHPADWVEESCGKCKRAREAQETWIADRDAKIAAGKAAVAAEQREARRLEQRQIDDCRRCDERGILPTAVRCTHDQRSDPDQLPPGRAAFLAERAKLAARAAQRAKTTDAPPATGEQLRLIAIRFGEHGVNDRDKRLAVLGEIVSRQLGSSRELTRVEATVVLDRFDHPPVEDPPEVLPGAPDYVQAEVVDAEIVESEDEGIPSNAESDGPADLAAQALDDEDDVPPPDDLDDATGGFEDEYRADQQTWADAEPDPSYVYAGGPNDPPF